MLCLHSQEIYNVTILLLGINNAGKTTLLANLLREPPAYVVPTIGYRQVSYKHKRAQITFIDLGGGGSIRGIWHNYYALAHAVVYIVDVSDMEKLEESREVLTELSQHTLMQDKPILVFGNKEDKLRSGTANEVEQLFGLGEDPCPSQRTDSVDTLDPPDHDCRNDVTQVHNMEDINQVYDGGVLQQEKVHTSSSDIRCIRAPSHSSLVERGLVRFRYCSAINQGRDMRHKVILKSLSWLLRAVRSNWSKLESRVCRDSSEQLEREKRERRERAEQVRTIKEERQRVMEQTENRPHSGGKSKNPFLPIAMAVEKAERQEKGENHIPTATSESCEDIEETAPPNSAEASAEIAQYFEDASKRISEQDPNSDQNRTMLGVEESLFVKHVSSDPGPSQDEYKIHHPLHTIHEGPSKSLFHKKRRRNRIAPMNPSTHPLGPIRSSPGSPPSSLFQSFQKSQRQMNTEVYPLMPSNPWCRPFTPDSEEREENDSPKHQALNPIQESISLPDITETPD